MAVGAEPRTEIAHPSFLERDYENGGFLVNTELKARTHLYVVSIVETRCYEYLPEAKHRSYLS